MNRNHNLVLIILIAFVSGFLSVLIFHQPMLIILKAIALAPDKLTNGHRLLRRFTAE